jgi:hypothetical protein
MSLNNLLRFSSRCAGTSVGFIALLAALVVIGPVGQQNSVAQEPEVAAPEAATPEADAPEAATTEQPPTADTETEAGSPSDAKPEEAKGNTPVPVRSSSSSRKLAPGVLQVIEPDLRPEDTFEGPLPLDLVATHPELVWQAPDFPDGRPLEAAKSETLIDKASATMLRHSVYGFEIGFKPVRQIEVDVPQPSGKLQRRLIWYMLYRLRYTGGDLQPKPEVDAFGAETFPQPQRVGYQSRRIFPSFVLIEKPTNKEYLDRVIPAAKAVIAEREKVGQPIYDSLELQTISIPRSTETENHEVWGVATWESLDPRIDYFAVQVQGLTNAFHVEIKDGAKRYLRKTLQLNFWRPGDTIDMMADKIRYGVPALADPVRQNEVLAAYGLSERLDYLWIYR